MRAVIQRVSRASLTIDDRLYSSIDSGLVVLLGIHEDDATEDVSWLASKIAQMRIFSDSDGKMNLSALDINGSIMVVSQFTLHASTKKAIGPHLLKLQDQK